MKISVQDNLYFELPKSDYSEQDLEDNIRLNLPSIYIKEFDTKLTVLNFKKKLYSRIGNVHADLIAFTEDFSQWWVIEVELITHDFDDHVYPQMEKLSLVDYSADAIGIYKSCYKYDNSLDEEKFIDMVEMIVPKLVVIADRSSNDWEGSLKALNVEMVSFVPHRNDKGKYVFHLKGNAFENRRFEPTIVYFDYLTKIFEFKDIEFNIRGKNNDNAKIVVNIPFLGLTDTANVLGKNLFLDQHASKLPKGNYILTDLNGEYELEQL